MALGTAEEELARLRIHMLSGQEHFHLVALSGRADLVVIDIARSKGLVVVHEPFGIDGEIVFPDYCHGRPDAGYHHEGNHDPCDSGTACIHALILIPDRMEPQIFRCDEHRQGDEYAVDEEEVESAHDIVRVESRDSEAHGAEWGHQGCRDGHAGDHGAAFPAGVLKHSGDTAENGDQDVVDGRIGTRQKLCRMLKVQRRDEEEHRGGDDAYRHHDAEIPEMITAITNINRRIWLIPKTRTQTEC